MRRGRVSGDVLASLALGEDDASDEKEGDELAAECTGVCGVGLGHGVVVVG